MNSKLLLERNAIRLKRLAHLVLAEDENGAEILVRMDILDSPLLRIFLTLYYQGMLGKASSVGTKDPFTLISDLLTSAERKGYKFPKTKSAMDMARRSPITVPDEVNPPNIGALSAPIRKLRQTIAKEEAHHNSQGLLITVGEPELRLVADIEKSVKDVYNVDSSSARDLTVKSKKLDAVYDRLSNSINITTKTSPGVVRLPMYGIDRRNFSVVNDRGEYEDLSSPGIWAVSRGGKKLLKNLSEQYEKQTGGPSIDNALLAFDRGRARIVDIIPPPTQLEILFPLGSENKADETLDALRRQGDYDVYKQRVYLSVRSKVGRYGYMEVVTKTDTEKMEYDDEGELVPIKSYDLGEYDQEKGFRELPEDTTVQLAFGLFSDALLTLRKGRTVNRSLDETLMIVSDFISSVDNYARSFKIQGHKLSQGYQSFVSYRSALQEARKSSDGNMMSLVRLPPGMMMEEEEGSPIASFSVDRKVPNMMTKVMVTPVQSTQFSGFVDFDQDYHMMIIWSHHVEGEEVKGENDTTFTKELLRILRANSSDLERLMGAAPLLKEVRKGAMYTFGIPFSVYSVSEKKNGLVAFITKVNKQIEDASHKSRLTRGIKNRIEDEDLQLAPRRKS